MFKIFSQSLSFDISLERGKVLFLMRCWRGGLKVRPGKSTAVLGGDIRIFYVIIITCPASLDNSIINSQNNNNNIHYITQGTQVDYDVSKKNFSGFMESHFV